MLLSDGTLWWLGNVRLEAILGDGNLEAAPVTGTTASHTATTGARSCRAGDSR